MRKSVFYFFVLSILISSSIYAQDHSQRSPQPKPRKQFFTFYKEWSRTSMSRFNKYPLSQLTGTKIVFDPNNPAEGYRSRDGLIVIKDLILKRGTESIGARIYPFGLRNELGYNLVLKASYENLPSISFSIVSSGKVEKYSMTDSRSYDLGIGAMSSDRSVGWGLGANGYIIAGKGFIKEPGGKGIRYFVEGGGGLITGPLGFEIFFELAQNRFYQPRPHSYLTVPIGVRGTLSF